jgi:hypothetical protein
MLLAVPVAIFFLAMGIAALALPERILATFGVSVESADGRTEVRAVYGGFGSALGVLLVVALWADSIRDGAFVAIAVALAGMAGGRIVSALLGEPVSIWPTWFFFAIELALASMLVVAATA